MKISHSLRAALVALVAFAGLSGARADEGTVSLVIYKAGWIIGGSGGHGVLHFRGRTYGLSTGGLDYGLVFGGSKTILRGRVSNIYSPSDVAGPRHRRRRPRDRADQPEGRRAGAVRAAGRPDGERGFERASDHAAVAME